MKTKPEPIPGTYVVSFNETGEALVEGPGVTRYSRVQTLVDDIGISLAFGTLLPPHFADLLDVTAAVYVADRLCSRRPRGQKRSALDELWQRRMTIRVPLRDPHAWLGARRTKLESLLSFLTDDLWTLEPTEEQPQLRLSELQASLFQDSPTGDVTAALLSGGLDSLAGLVAELSTYPRRTVIAFSARTNARIGVYQRRQVKRLVSLFGPRIRHVPVHIKLEDRAPGAYDHEDPSQRTRGFVFQIFGAITAAMAGVDVLHVYENGIGALNLPYSAAQLGSQATRATHPLTVTLVSDLLTDVLGRPFRVLLPHQFDTKTEMCSVFASDQTAALAQLAISCDNFPQRVAGRPQCGICPSCLLSRQSLFSAGLRAADPSDRFCNDIYSLHGSTAISRCYHFRVMSGQAAALSVACDTVDPWAALVRQFPILLEVADSHLARTGREPSKDIISLYRRYCTEWNGFWNEIAEPTVVTV